MVTYWERPGLFHALGKGWPLASCLWESHCKFVTFPLVSWVRCGIDCIVPDLCTLSYFVAGGQWLSGIVLDSRPRGPGFKPHRRHCVVVLLARHIYPCLVLVQPRKTCPCLTERLLMGHKESNLTNKQTYFVAQSVASPIADTGVVSSIPAPYFHRD